MATCTDGKTERHQGGITTGQLIPMALVWAFASAGGSSGVFATILQAGLGGLVFGSGHVRQCSDGSVTVDLYATAMFTCGDITFLGSKTPKEFKMLEERLR